MTILIWLFGIQCVYWTASLVGAIEMGDCIWLGRSTRFMAFRPMFV